VCGTWDCDRGYRWHRYGKSASRLACCSPECPCRRGWWPLLGMEGKMKGGVLAYSSSCLFQSTTVRLVVPLTSLGDAGIPRVAAMAIDRWGPTVNGGPVRVASVSADHWPMSAERWQFHRLCFGHTPRSNQHPFRSDNVAVKQALQSGFAWSVINHRGHPRRRLTPNPALVRTGRLRRPAAQLSR
jgi:hypothetical protein